MIEALVMANNVHEKVVKTRAHIRWEATAGCTGAWEATHLKSWLSSGWCGASMIGLVNKLLLGLKLSPTSW